jgi:hypothetical protein
MATVPVRFVGRFTWRTIMSWKLALAMTMLGAASLAAQAPAGATAKCVDGSYTKVAVRAGACGSHGGVKTWLVAPAATAATPPAATTRPTGGAPLAPGKTPMPRPADTAQPTPAPTFDGVAKPPGDRFPAPPASAPKGTVAMCTDGTYSQSASASGTCSGHGGVKVWYKAKGH